MRSRHIVIAGAGIGGLTAALALAARGHTIQIIDKATELKPVGAGVQLSPNASRILIALGLRDALAARATAPEAIVLNSVRAGGKIARLPLVQTADAPYWVMHRADLQAALVAAVDAQTAITLRLGKQIGNFSPVSDRVGVGFGGETVEADILIGADGVGSQIRQTLFPEEAPRFSGRIAWRGMADRSGPAEVKLWMGASAHLVAYPVAGIERTNLVVTLPGDRETATAVSGETIAAGLARAGWPDAPCAQIAAAAMLTPYPLFTVAPLTAWNVGPVALLGDAAHAMLPFAAQGAAMATEDAAVLANCLGAGAADVAAALTRYGASRRSRVAHVARAAAQSGRIYHLRGAMAFARDNVIRLLGGPLLLKRQSWIYDWQDQ